MIYQVQGLGTNPIYELAKKWGLDIVENNYDDLAFYDNHGKINGTKAYNDFNDALDASYDLAGKSLPAVITLFLFRFLKMSCRKSLQDPSS